MLRYFTICLCLSPALVLASLAEPAAKIECTLFEAKMNRNVSYELRLFTVTTDQQQPYVNHESNSFLTATTHVESQPENYVEVPLHPRPDNLIATDHSGIYQDMQARYLITAPSFGHTLDSCNLPNVSYANKTGTCSVGASPVVPRPLAWVFFLAGFGSLTLRSLVNRRQNPHWDE